MIASLEEQSETWEAYRLARMKADSSVDYSDRSAVASAYRAFYAAFVGEPPPSPVDLVSDRKVLIFPVHNVRSRRKQR